MSRGFPAVLTAACFTFTTLMAPPVIGFGVFGAEAATTVKSSKSNTSDRMGGGGGKGKAGRTTVKSSKSNTSDRMGGGGGKGKAGRTTVKSSKSNTSDRMGGGGGLGFGAGQLNPQPEPPGRAKAR